MGADNIDTPPPPADSPSPGSDKSLGGPDTDPHRDEGTPADLDLRRIQDIEPVHRAPEGLEVTPDDHRREGAAHFARAGADYREADRIIDGDRTQGWAARAEDATTRAGKELAAGHREVARANQAERFGFENESRSLLAQAGELERNGDAEGAKALRNEADAKTAAAYERFDRALDQLSKAQDHESQAEDAWKGKSGSNLCETAATFVENGPDALGPVKDVAAAGLRAMGQLLEVYGVEGLRDVLAGLAREVRAKLP